MTRTYSKVTDEKRQMLIEMINMNMTIKDAARSVDIKYENAKAIYRVYRKEQRTDKRRNRFRYKLPPGVSRNSLTAVKLRQKAAEANAMKMKKGNIVQEEEEGDEDDEMNEGESIEDEESLDEDQSALPEHPPE